jgi:hypothetical protein
LRRIDELLNIQRLLYDVSGMEPPEGSTPDFVAELRSMGYPVMMLTGRGPGTMTATLRELAANRYIPTDVSPCGPPRCGDVLCSAPGIISMVAIRKASEKAETCFPNSQLESLSRPIHYANGVLMAAGQDKGKILKLLLASTTEGCRGNYLIKGGYKAIVLVDDDEKNTTNMQNAFASSDMKDRVIAIRCGKLDGDVNAFHANGNNRQEKTDASWRALKKTICDEVTQFCQSPLSCP